MRRAIICLAAALNVAGGIGPAGAQTTEDMSAQPDDMFGDHVPYQDVFEGFKDAIAADEEAVASMVDYPFSARRDNGAVDYNDIIGPSVKDV